jgi:N-methylhydantoinase B
MGEPVGMDDHGLDALTLEILWSRLVSIVDESATALQRTSFSTTVRESNDLACVLMSPDGASVAENTIGVPSFAGVMSRLTRNVLATHPVERWHPGDVLITNDPWLNTGHLPDTAVITPIFLDGRLVAFAGNTAHKSDIGGIGYSADGKEIFEEGLRIPPTKLYKEGVLNEDLLRLIERNVRVPVMVTGDIHAQVSAGHVCAERLLEVMRSQGLTEIESLGAAIRARAEASMRRAIAALPDGEYRGEVVLDGYSRPTHLVATVGIDGDELTIDFTGTSDQSDGGINSVFNYTYAFTCYTVKCVLDPDTRKNEGAYEPMTVIAPEGSILNASFPAAVNARSMTGHCVSSAILQALSQACSDQVIADSGSCPGLRVCCYGTDSYGDRYVQMLFPNGGMGARPAADGLNTTPFPTNAGGASIEVMEGVAPLLFRRREFTIDSGGPGEWRGGCGQVVEIEFLSDRPTTFTTQFDRIENPPFGLLGGLPGAPAGLRLNGEVIAPKGRFRADRGHVLELTYSGGGGYGDPSARDRAAIEEDIGNGLVSPEAARSLYGYTQ